MNDAGAFAEAFAHHQAGRLSEAEAIYRRILQNNPDHSDSLHLLGFIAHQVGRNDAAAALIGRAIAVRGDVAAYHSNLGNALMGLGRLDEAVAAYRAALRLNPDLAPAHSNLGVALKALGRLDEAVAAYAEALRLNPNLTEARVNQGLALIGLGRVMEAIAAFAAALRVNPDHAEAHYNLGVALSSLDRFDEAAAAYESALRVRPDHAEAWSNLGVARAALGRPEEALTAYHAALRLKPEMAETHSNLGALLKAMGRLDEAIAAHATAARIQPDHAEAHAHLASALRAAGRHTEALDAYASALRLKPDHAEAYFGMGNALNALGRIGDAAAAYQAATRVRPEYPEALSNLGLALTDLGRLTEAIDAFAAALRARPNYPTARYNLGNALMALGRIDEAVAAYAAAVDAKPDFIEARGNLVMTMNYSPRFSNPDFLVAARAYAAALGPSSAGRRFANAPDPVRRLRVGYVSGDFKSHPVGHFLVGVLDAHDRDRFEVTCYSNNAGVDAVTERLRSAAARWRNIANLPDATVDEMVVADGIDILIDLSGHTALNRLPLFARKPAPLQATWLGYVGTTGLDAMDYILADRHVVPAGEEAAFVETVWRLPDSYLCFTPPDGDHPIRERDAWEPLTLGCFNTWAKITPETIRLWAAILAALPDARLFLKTPALGDREVGRAALETFAAHGVAPERLLLEGKAPRAELLAAYNRVDIALDPLTYGGGLTTLEALWMGVPVVSWRGDRWAGRHSASILNTMGLSEFLVADVDRYLETVVGLARDRARLARWRRDLRPMLEASALCDGQRMASSVETAYREMWRRWCRSRASMNGNGRPIVPPPLGSRDS